MRKRQIEPFAHGRVRLRLLSEPDLPMTLAWRNQDHIRKWFFDSAPITAEQHRAWFAQYADRDDDFVFIIEETREFLKPVGQLAVYKIDYAVGRGEFGRILIGEADAARTGLAREATRLLVHFTFEQLGLIEVVAFVKNDNLVSQRMLLSSGFHETGERNELKGFIVRSPQGAKFLG
jgi:RimJ/RimL family protein N-acetyltransferase